MFPSYLSFASETKKRVVASQPAWITCRTEEPCPSKPTSQRATCRLVCFGEFQGERQCDPGFLQAVTLPHLVISFETDTCLSLQPEGEWV